MLADTAIIDLVISGILLDSATLDFVNSGILLDSDIPYLISLIALIADFGDELTVTVVGAGVGFKASNVLAAAGDDELNLKGSVDLLISDEICLGGSGSLDGIPEIDLLESTGLLAAATDAILLESMMLLVVVLGTSPAVLAAAPFRACSEILDCWKPDEGLLGSFDLGDSVVCLAAE